MRGAGRPSRPAPGHDHLADGLDRARRPDRHVEARAVRPPARTGRGSTGCSGGTRRRRRTRSRFCREEAPGEPDRRRASGCGRRGSRPGARRRPRSTRRRCRTRRALRSNTGTAWSTPRWIRRASSKPEITSTSTPASSRARSTNSPGSRPRARPWSRRPASWRRGSRPPAGTGRARRCHGRSRRASSRFMSPADEPSRTISFSRSRTSMRSLVAPGRRRGGPSSCRCRPPRARSSRRRSFAR